MSFHTVPIEPSPEAIRAEARPYPPMIRPDPLPEPGWWLVINDDELYEVRHCANPDGSHCTTTVAEDDGLYYWSADEAEAIWTPWNDASVTAVYPTRAEAEAAIAATRTTP